MEIWVRLRKFMLLLTISQVIKNREFDASLRWILYFVL